MLNAAWGKQRNFGMVNTSAGYYRNSGIEFYGIEALDIAVFPLFEHFHTATDFIDQALRDGGKVLVHCGEGISRSSTLVLAYLMIKRGFRVQDAVRQVVKHRNILPNQGFLLQLCQLHDHLQSSSVPPSPSPTVRSSVSPMPDLKSPLPQARPTYDYSHLYRNDNTIRQSTSNYSRASSITRDRCPSPSPSRAWSNGWSPPAPARCSSPSRSYLNSTNSYTKYSPKSSYLSNDVSSSRPRRCQSVDREYGSSSIYGNSIYGRKQTYSNSLMSSYISRPLHLASIR